MLTTKNTRLPAVLAAAASVLLAAAGCSSGGSSAGASGPSTGAQSSASCVKVPASALTSPGELKVGVNATLPPLAYQSASGQLEGERIELAKELAKVMCLKPDFTNAVATSLLPSLNANRIDVIDIGYFVTPARTKVMEMIPTEEMGVSVVTKKGNPEHIKSTDDLAGKHVATSNGSYEESVIKAINQDQVNQGAASMVDQSFDNYDLVFQSLASGQVDAAVTTSPVAKYYAEKGGFALAVNDLKPTPTSLTVKGGNDALASSIVAALNEMRKSGFYAKLMNKYGLTPLDQFQVQWTGP